MTITVQTNYDFTPQYKIAPGMLADGDRLNVESITVDSGGCNFGHAVFQKAGVERMGTMSPTSGSFLGVAVADAGQANGITANAVVPDAYDPWQSANVCRLGLIYVIAYSDVTTGAAAFATSTGGLTADSAGNTAVSASFRDTALAGSIVRLRVR